MIQLLFSLLSLEVAVALLLLFRTPGRRAAIVALDRLKRGRGPVVAKTVAAVLLVVLASSANSIFKIRRRAAQLGQLTPTDQVLASRHLLEASLMAYSLFLGLIIDRLHHYVRELRLLRKNAEAVKQQSIAKDSSGSGEFTPNSSAIEKLKDQIDLLKRDLDLKDERLQAAEANATAMRKQSEGLAQEYDRLLAENLDLKSRLESVDSGSLLASKKSL